jgi:hypothetical protein
MVDAVDDAKVDKVTGKGLSTNDFTTAYKNKLDTVKENATVVTASTTNGNIKIDGVETTVYELELGVKDITDLNPYVAGENITLTPNASGVVTIASQTSDKHISKTIAIEDWVAVEGTTKFKADVTVADMTSDSMPVVDINASSATTEAEANNLYKN